MNIIWMTINRSNSKLDVTLFHQGRILESAWITSKPDFTLQCDKASAKAVQSLGLTKRTFTHLTKECTKLTLSTFGILCSICNLYLARNIDKLEQMPQS